MSQIKVLVTGACGKMGQEVVRAVVGEDDLELVGAVDPQGQGREIGVVAGIRPLGITVNENLAAAIASSQPQVMVDFTKPDAVMDNIRAALAAKVACVVGTTGITPADLEEVKSLCQKQDTPALIAPNFAIGAVLMMQFAATAAKYFPSAEIVELHHDQKLDAPSGTALKTAEMMRTAQESQLVGEEAAAAQDLPSRGLSSGKIQIHSVRLPGLVAHQEVIFGGLGQTLTIRHDSISRESFMPGLLMAIRKVQSLSGLVYGLENIL